MILGAAVSGESVHALLIRKRNQLMRCRAAEIRSSGGDGQPGYKSFLSDPIVIPEAIPRDFPAAIQNDPPPTASIDRPTTPTLPLSLPETIAKLFVVGSGTPRELYTFVQLVSPGDLAVGMPSIGPSSLGHRLALRQLARALTLHLIDCASPSPSAICADEQSFLHLLLRRSPGL